MLFFWFALRFVLVISLVCDITHNVMNIHLEPTKPLLVLPCMSASKMCASPWFSSANCYSPSCSFVHQNPIISNCVELSPGIASGNYKACLNAKQSSSLSFQIISFFETTEDVKIISKNQYLC